MVTLLLLLLVVVVVPCMSRELRVRFGNLLVPLDNDGIHQSHFDVILPCFSHFFRFRAENEGLHILRGLCWTYFKGEELMRHLIVHIWHHKLEFTRLSRGGTREERENTGE